MTRDEVVGIARQRLIRDGVKLKSLEPSHVESTNVRMTRGRGVPGWLVEFEVDYPEWPDYEFILVEVYEPLGEVTVLEHL